MDMLVVSGFLGSGKTTMILATIGKYIETTKKKVVIIVNDFGKIGIDGAVMKKYGLNVQDMPSGCICCTLGSDFLETVNTVASNFRPDLILVEPTGIADPANIVDTMKMYRGPKVDPIRIFVVVDAVRFPLILRALTVPLKNQLNAADLIVINKIDESGPEAVQVVRTSLEELGIRKRTIQISAATGENLDQVVQAMVGV
ncbi:MAG TPA: GTP-binding protein [Methanomassiliicoccales archaeon]|jgi:G3E family GTPase